MSDKIVMKGMEFFGRHGVFPEEKAMGQKFIVDVKMKMDLKKAGETDDLLNTLNYADVYAEIKNIVTQKTFNLIEALGEDIAKQILKLYPVEEVKVKVKKPHAPISGIFDYMGCEIKRKRNDLKKEK